MMAILHPIAWTIAWTALRKRKVVETDSTAPEREHVSAASSTDKCLKV